MIIDKFKKYTLKEIIIKIFKRIKNKVSKRYKKIKKVFEQRFFIQTIHKIYLTKPSKDFRNIKAGLGLEKLINDFEFNSILDIGSGEGIHSELLKKYGKKVISLDYGKSPYFEKSKDKDSCLIGDYNKYKFANKFDCIWASHVLEHQLEPHGFLQKIYNDLKDDGILAITVPPMKPTIVGGHVNLYNPGLLLYRVILAGFDCSNASLLWYDYNITLIVRKSNKVDLSNLTYDKDDVFLLKKYFPKQISSDNMRNFNGNITRINW